MYYISCSLRSDSRSLGFGVVAFRPLKNESRRGVFLLRLLLKTGSSFPRDGYFQVAARFVIASSRPFASQNLQALLVVSFSVRRMGGVIDE